MLNHLKNDGNKADVIVLIVLDVRARGTNPSIDQGIP